MPEAIPAWVSLLGTAASLVSVFVMLNIKLAIANLQRDIEAQRRKDQDEIQRWVEQRFQRRHDGERHHAGAD